MPSDSPEPDPKEVERRKKEILAAARGEKQAGGPNPMAGIGIQFAVTLLVCVFAGQWLDRRLGTGPWLILVGMIIGGGVGFWTLVRAGKAATGEGEGKGKGEGGA
jgi:F0F1-type ATP synthase assembly protein I